MFFHPKPVSHCLSISPDRAMQENSSSSADVGFVASWRRRWRTFCRVGPLYALQIAITRVFPRRVLTVSTFYVVEARLRKALISKPPDPDMRWATLGDIGLFEREGLPPEKIKKRFEQASRIAICERGGRLIGYFAYEVDVRQEHDWLHLRLGRDMIWTSFAWVAPKHRNKGMHARIRYFAVSDFCQKGFTRSLATIDALNVPSLRSMLKNAIIIDFIFFIRFFDLTLLRTSRITRVGWWNAMRPFELATDLFPRDSTGPYGPANTKRFERIIAKPG